jgi:hypothetical protein
MIHPPFAHKFHQDNSHPWHTKSDTKNLYIYKLYISHKNQEISIFTIKKKQSKVKTFQQATENSKEGKTKQRTKDQETKNQVNVKAVRTTVPVSPLFRDHQFMYIYKMRIGIYVIKQALLLEEVETTLHHVKIEHIVRCLQAAKPYYKQFNSSNVNPHSKLKILGSTLTGHKLVGTMDRFTVQWRSRWYLDASDIFMHKKSPAVTTWVVLIIQQQE